MTDEVIDKHQKLLIEYVLSNRELFVKCIRIMDPSYFDKPLDRVIKFVKDYFQKYNDIAKFDVIDAETDVELGIKELGKADHDYVSEEMEKFCREQAMMQAVFQGVDLVNDGDVASVEGLVREALRVKLDNSLGTDLFDNPQERIEQNEENKDHRKIGIEAYDSHIGQIGRGELGIIAAPSGGGKSLGLANIGYYLARQDLDILYISLELDEGLYSKRLDTIVTNYDIKEHVEAAEEIANDLALQKDNMGSMIVKRMRNGTTASDIRAFVMEYFIQKGKYPDVLCVDYLAGMGVDGVKSQIGVNKHDIDKEKSEALREIADECWMYSFTAAQVGRSGIDLYCDISPAHIQGGISMIQTSDWTLAQVQNEEDLDNNQFKTSAMKLRNESKTGKMLTGYINPHTLRFGNVPQTTTKSINRKKIKTDKQKSIESQNDQPIEDQSKEDDNPAKSKVKSAMSKLK